MSICKIFSIDDGEQHWCSARNKKEALEVYLEPDIGKVDLDTVDEDKLPVYLDEIDIEELDPSTVIDVKMEGTNDEANEIVSQTAEEWAMGGVGIIASTLFYGA